MADRSYRIGFRRELMLDDFLTQARSGEAEFRQHAPRPQPAEPSQPSGYYSTVIADAGRFRIYYRDRVATPEGTPGPFPGYFPGEYMACADSDDGIHWSLPDLNLFPGFPANAVWVETMASHNLAPFIDGCPGCPPERRYKALGGTNEGGLYAFASADGFRWRKLSGEPVMTLPRHLGTYAFDSQNVAFWSAAEECYVLYFRIVIDGIRCVAKTVSADFLHWEEPVIEPLNLPGEHLYVSQMAPYCREPDLYIGTPTRYFEGRGSATDVTLCFSRGGGALFRPFPGGWIWPGTEPERWLNRANYIARNIIETKPGELSLYHCSSRVRFTLRMDGFISLHGGLGGGEWVSRPMIWPEGGVTMEFNVATSAGGRFEVEMLDAAGRALPGCSFADGGLFFGDEPAWRPAWRERPAPETEFRLRCRLAEADWYSFKIKNT